MFYKLLPRYVANVKITPGSGDFIAAEDIASIKYQKVKLIDPTTNSTTGIGIQSNPFWITSDTTATSLGKATAATAGATDTGIAPLAIRDDALSTLTPAEGKYVPLRTNSTGALWVTGNLQYVTDTTFGTDTGTLGLAVRRDANTTLASVSGNYAPLQLNAAGSLKVAITAGAGSGGTSLADQAAFTSASTSFTPVGGLYQASADTLVDGTAAAVAIDVNRFMKVTLATNIEGEDGTNHVLGVVQKFVAASTYSPSLYSELTQVTKANIKASAGNVLAFTITNSNAAVRYFQLHNKATAPAGTDVPIFSWPIVTGTGTTLPQYSLGADFFTRNGKYFGTGIGWAISTTYGTFTDSATAAEHIAYVHYI